MLVLMLLGGVGFFVYPDVASWWNGRSQRGIIQAYDEEVAQMHYDRIDDMLQRARDYNASRPELSISDPFADIADLPDTYLELLNVSGIMARIEIPAINVDLPVMHGTSSAVLDIAAGHLAGTHLPVGGYSTHSVITAHSGLSNARMFTDLLSDRVGPGTLFFITVLGERFVYEVDYVQVIYPHEVDALRVYPGRDLVTLITCTPLAVNSHRLLVRGTRIPYSPELIAEIVPYISVLNTNWRLISTLAIFTLFILVFSVYQIIRILRGRHSKMLERKIEQLERQLAVQKGTANGQRSPGAAAAGPNFEFDDPYISMPASHSIQRANNTPQRKYRVKPRAKSSFSFRRSSVAIAVVLLVAGATITVLPRVLQQLYTRYATTIINDWRDSLDENRTFIINRWEGERDAFWETVSELPIAYNGDISVVETGHIYIRNLAFGASGGTPAVNHEGYLTLGGVTVGNNGYITIANMSVDPFGGFNISTNGNISINNLYLDTTGSIYVGNHYIGDIALEDLDTSDYDLNFIFNFNPEEDPMQWLYQEMINYNHTLYITDQSQLVSLESTEEIDFSVYQNAGFTDEMLGYIFIEAMNNLTLPIFAGSSHGNLLRGAGHLTQSSLPVGGINTNSVITAHRGLSRARMFRDIEMLEPGHLIQITNFYQTLTYIVVDTRIIEPNDIDAVKIQSGRDMLTLMTCHPYRINSQRWLVFAERVH